MSWHSKLGHFGLWPSKNLIKRDACLDANLPGYKRDDTHLTLKLIAALKAGVVDTATLVP